MLASGVRNQASYVLQVVNWVSLEQGDYNLFFLHTSIIKIEKFRYFSGGR